MNSRILLLLSSFALPALPGCQSPLEVHEARWIELRVDAAGGVRNGDGGEIVLPLAVENAGRETVRLPTCGAALLFEVQRLEDGRWVNARAAVCPAVLDMVAVPLAPGETVRNQARLGATPGRYRLALALTLQDGDARTVTSEAFLID